MLNIRGNQISDISALAGLSNLEWLFLADNNISDISSLVQNSGLSDGDTVDLSGNPLSTTSINVYIPQLEARGVIVEY
jgi:Leucine-rich repeat (LRR) protein